MQIKALHVSALTYILKSDFIEFVCCLKKMKSASVNSIGDQHLYIIKKDKQ